VTRIVSIDWATALTLRRGAISGGVKAQGRGATAAANRVRMGVAASGVDEVGPRIGGEGEEEVLTEGRTVEGRTVEGREDGGACGVCERTRRRREKWKSRTRRGEWGWTSADERMEARGKREEARTREVVRTAHDIGRVVL
jgi:hypothetical protein